ncbi:chemotaxis protein [Cupriavidus oxalaticus]|uniref:Chemotaxis protein n=1 Tax=Cupriavidus oxalaticus TaxID=96344 RepID=A0A5P3VLR5_9BURK|nr:chemotaxis protein [Cupriavidus oxalaticus]QEZ47170.1 chemotaxis protein [Cupriavidus oxalaticus]
MDMNDLKVPGGIAGAIGYITAAIGGAVWFVRLAWRKDRVDGAQTQAEIDIIARLSDQLDKANARAALAEQRADLAYKERNEAYREIGELKGTIAALTAEVRLLKERLDGKAT